MQAVRRSYKRWQCGEEHEKAVRVMKHFFPTEYKGSGLNVKTRIETFPVADAIKRALTLRREGDDPRAVVLSIRCNLSKEQ
jgi:hypothetical protein